MPPTPTIPLVRAGGFGAVSLTALLAWGCEGPPVTSPADRAEPLPGLRAAGMPARAMRGEPVLDVTLSSVPAGRLSIYRLEDFDPQVAPGARIDPARLGLGAVVAERPELNFAATLNFGSSTPDGRHEGLIRLAEYLTVDYLPKHPEIPIRLGIRSQTVNARLVPGKQPTIGHRLDRYDELLARVRAGEFRDYTVKDDSGNDPEPTAGEAWCGMRKVIVSESTKSLRIPHPR